MYYRRKIILALLQLFERQIDKISLQKLLFLFTQRQTKAEYEFIPYKYGCYSYSANADLTTMVQKGLLIETATHFMSNVTTDYFVMLKEIDKNLMLEVKSLYSNKSANALMKHTYINYPYWAINSVKANSILSLEEYNNVINNKPNGVKTILFTIGYEGISLEQYLNRLVKNDIKILIDVRNNPLSMKFGFSKGQLQRFCNSLGIEYLHLPEVGIQSDQRQALNTQADYDKLFDSYRKDNLTRTKTSQEKILYLLKEKKRIALTCFEANICQCHRKHLAEAIKNLPDFHYEIMHI